MWSNLSIRNFVCLYILMSELFIYFYSIILNIVLATIVFSNENKCSTNSRRMNIVYPNIETLENSEKFNFVFLFSIDSVLHDHGHSHQVPHYWRGECNTTWD